MDKTRTVNLLKHAAGEIQEQRRMINEMGERLWIVDSILSLANPRKKGGMCPDIVKELHEEAQRLNELKEVGPA